MNDVPIAGISFKLSEEQKDRVSKKDKAKTEEIKTANPEEKSLGKVEEKSKKQKDDKKKDSNEKVLKNQVAYLMTFSVLNPYRKHGIGKQMLEYGIQEFVKKNSIPKIQLHVHVENKEALIVYNRLGFKEIQLIENYYSQNIVPPHALLLEKIIT